MMQNSEDKLHSMYENMVNLLEYEEVRRIVSILGMYMKELDPPYFKIVISRSAQPRTNIVNAV